MDYTFKLNLVKKIENIKDKKILYIIFLILKNDNEKNYIINNSGIFIQFENLTNYQYDLLQKYLLILNL